MPHHQSPDAPVGVFGITHARFVFEPFLTIERAQFSAARSGMEISDPAVADAAPLEWSEEDIVFLHWRLLQEIANLADPDRPLDEKFDTLRWVFTEREKDTRAFSFVNCLRVVGCSPLSPIAYCGLVDAQEIRDWIWRSLSGWLQATLQRYPAWVREAVVNNPQWIEACLARNPQWINEQIKSRTVQADLFA